MATTRLTFLYPHLFRSIRNSEPAVRIIRRPSARRSNARNFSTAGRKRESLVQRHGKAVEPFLVQGETADDVKVFTPERENENESKETQSTKTGGTPENKAAQEDNDAKDARELLNSGPLSEETQAAMLLPGEIGNHPSSEKEGGEQPTPLQVAAANTSSSKAPLETVLQMPPPKTQEEENTEKPPHLQTPPYVHHFDTYTLVQQVEAGGFTPDQSVTTMKAVRGLLAENMDIARRGLVSKSDVENESYLFRAACSELRTEVQNQRKANDEYMRRERTLLQHEADILSQKMSQELLALRDDLKGMFDDRKMSVRMEQRALESAIQQLNYKITVDLNSDSKSEVEGVRWILTRRSVFAILFMAFMVLSSLRYGSYKAHEEEVRKKKLAEVKHDNRTNEMKEVSAAEILAAN